MIGNRHRTNRQAELAGIISVWVSLDEVVGSLIPSRSKSSISVFVSQLSVVVVAGSGVVHSVVTMNRVVCVCVSCVVGVM